MTSPASWRPPAAGIDPRGDPVQPKEAFSAISSTEKIAVSLRNNRKPVRIGVRLTNVFKLMVVLAHHIGE